MLARDVMTTAVLTVAPDTDVAEIARTLLESHVSALPVVDANGALVGIVSEGDLMNRDEGGTRHPSSSWWLRLVGAPEENARTYLKSYGRRARDVMTKDPITVPPDMPLSRVAALLEKHHVKRVPVLEGGKLVGIVSRANLLRGVASWQPPAAIRVKDATLRATLLDGLARADLPVHLMNVTVNDGVVELWGAVATDIQMDAARAVVESTAGVVRFDNHLAVRRLALHWN